MLRFGEYVFDFTILARQILSNDRSTNAKIDAFADLLSALLDTMPEILQFGESWLKEEKKLPEWPFSAMAAGTSLYDNNRLLVHAHRWKYTTVQPILISFS
jgi:hypothetical protein